MTETGVPLRAIYQRVEERNRADLPLLSVYREFGVVLREGRDDNNNVASEDLSSYKVVCPGDLVLNKMKTWQGSLGVSSFQGIVSPAYFVGRRIADVDDHFMHHLLRSAPMIAEYGSRSKGIRPNQWDLSWDEFAAIKIDLPTRSKQTAIANFLDSELSKIEALISKKQRLHELLDERLISLVNALFHSRNTEKTIPLKFVSKIISGQSPPEETYNEEGNGLPLVNGPAEFTDGDWGTTLSIRWTTDPRATAPKGTILFCLRGATTGRLNRANDLIAAGRGVAGLKGVAIDDESLFFAVFALRGDVIGQANGSTFPSVTSEQLGRLLIPALSHSEFVERRIVASSALEQRNELVHCVSRQISLLQERRQALITEAVTGKLDITGAAA